MNLSTEDFVQVQIIVQTKITITSCTVPVMQCYLYSNIRPTHSLNWLPVSRPRHKKVASDYLKAMKPYVLSGMLHSSNANNLAMLSAHRTRLFGRAGPRHKRTMRWLRAPKPPGAPVSSEVPGGNEFSFSFPGFGQ